MAAAAAASAPSAEATMRRLWTMPTASSSLGGLFDTAYPLKVMNSLTRSKTPFIPIDGRRVLWYMCGPTVYDAAHMGHARTYICFDILRRIMAGYFSYDVVLCMNITDIDDKIIMRSNEAKVPFAALAREHEASFLADMDALGVAPPDVLTRVSEYVPEVVAFIAGIIERGYAYAANGSVYFDTVAYAANPHHAYGKLVPENVGNAGATDEGEGALSAGAGDKRAPCDFALWKASKPAEPAWDSPWGAGRPGWHIECSAMCGDALGGFARGRIDVHSGGTDLRFPHHENEIAQSEACLGDGAQWCNYFVHSGHLHIEGLKMSKSLKNFIKIGDAVERYGARALRFLCLLSRYNAPMHYSDRAMEGVAGVERVYVDFFASAKAALRSERGARAAPQHWGAADKAFAAALARAKADVRAALADDFNTPGALAALGDLVRETNKYMGGGAAAPFVPLLLRAAAGYVTDMFRIFGLVDAATPIGFSDAAAGGGGAGREETLAPLLDVVAAFRERVRDAARAGDTGGILALCDALRDGALAPLGVKLEDVAGAPPAAAWAPSASRWKLASAADLAREREAAAAAGAERAARKAEAAAEAARKAAEKDARARIDPRTLWDGDAAFGARDADGVPTHDAAGAELPKSKVKSLRKEWEVQNRLFTSRAQPPPPPAQ